MIIDFDIESTGLQPYSGRNEAFLWIFSDGETHEAIPFSPSGAAIESWGYRPHDPRYAENQKKIQAWFDRVRLDSEAKIRAWNARFDRAFADRAGCFKTPGDGQWLDAMLVAHAIDERRSVALKAVAAQLFGDDAADPQKKLKEWLTAENKRRAKLLKDADKAEQGKLRVKYVQVKCSDRKCKNLQELPEGEIIEGACPDCGAEFKTTNKTRPATDEEAASVIAEAALVMDEKGEYVRANYSNVPQEIMEPYALEDVILTRKISEVYDPVVEASDLKRVVEFEHKNLDALYAIEKRGLPVKDHGVEYRRLEHEVIENLEKLEERIHDLVKEADPVVYAQELAGSDWGEGKTFAYKDEAGHLHLTGGAASLDDFNPKSTPQILAALKARGADMRFMTPHFQTGNIGADADNLRAVDDALSQAILDFRSEFKVLSTYTRPMIDRSFNKAMNVYKEPFIAPDSRIHATYRQVGARTGRMSCADPNMQNQPRDDLRLRYNITADPGHKLISCDLSNIEMVLFAAYCGEGRLLSAIRNGEDLHTLTAEMIGLRDRKRSGGGIETARQLGKVFNFTIIYGGGLRSIKKYFRCTREEAQRYKNRYMEAYPEVRRLQNRIDFRLADDGYIQDKLISGRRYRVAQRDSYKAVNYLVQGTASSVLKQAVNNLHLDGVPMVALVHDEVVAHVPEDEALDVAKLIEKRMTECPQLDGVVPLRAEYDIVDRWSDAKPLKDADSEPYYFDPNWANVPRRYVNENHTSPTRNTSEALATEIGDARD